MNYQRHYDKLITRARHRLLEGYTESHHIIPKCMGGRDEEDNLVNLTPGEHYVAHQLLVKIYDEPKLVYAAKMMTIGAKTNQRKNKLYGWLRRKHAAAVSLRQTGTKRTEETKKKMSEASKGKIKSETHKDNMRGKRPHVTPWNKGITTGIISSGAFKKGNTPWNLGLPGNFLGKKHSEETKKIMSIAAKSRPKDQCPHCDKIGQKSAMMKHHFDKCKFKEVL